MQSPRAIATIAYDWGFNNSGYFTRAFRDAYGVHPSDYRRVRTVRPRLS